ncbi:MAG: flagellar basal-body MS-ring/collar protein FliF [Myxococcales bacterium]|nr:flagellar basal-body MS-ring/collar protein FliF [Myxococcales bacterium]
MEALRNAIGVVGARWAALGGVARLGVAAFIAVFALVLISTSMGGIGPGDAVLFSDLDGDEEARIVERLQSLNIPHEVQPAGTVRVPADKVHEVRLRLAGEGVLDGGSVGFEVFDEQRFGETEFAEQVKYHRALEGELARTIGHLRGVERARVHLVLPSRSLFRSGEQQASASVVLHTRTGFRTGEEQIRGIVYLVASAVRGLDASAVTVVDGQGRALGAESTDDKDLASDALGFRREVERARELAAQELLDTALGKEHSMVRVSAAVNFTREERTEERYDPETIASRSFQISEESKAGTDRGVGGVPGTPSNLPGGEAPEAGAAGRDGLVRRTETRNYEVSKVVRHAVEPVGQVKGLQVAVIVDGIWKTKGEQRVFEKRGEEELARLKDLVATAVGIDTERGDKVTIECVPFAAVESPPEPGFTVGDAVHVAQPLLPYLGWAIVLLCLLIFVLALLRASARLAPQSALEAHQLGDGSQPMALPGVPGAMAVAASGGKGEDLDEMRALAAELANSEPESAARVIKGWITEQR